MFSPKPFVAMAAFAAVNLAAFADIEVNPIPDHPDWGYTVTEFPEAPDDIAIVFTNHNPESSMFWKMPHSADNVQFLVVGGGGGGASGTSGGGGGGGGVVTGFIYRVSKNSMVAASVGEGGSGGPAVNVQPATIGTDSCFKIDDVMYVTADGGGRGRGSSATGGLGGSGGGGRPAKAGGAASKGSIGDGVEDKMFQVELLGNAGGAGHSGGKFAAGGGGGATEVGGTATGEYAPGKGGEGVMNSITGVSLVYGSGGGGGTSRGLSHGAPGGSGAGNASWSNKNAKANRGGGGAGGASNANPGGAGGSGIVVIRYRQKPPVFKIIVR